MQTAKFFGTYLILYGIARFFIEFLRGDPGRGEVFGGIMTGTQLIAIILVIVGAYSGCARTQGGGSHPPRDSQVVWRGRPHPANNTST